MPLMTVVGGYGDLFGGILILISYIFTSAKCPLLCTKESSAEKEKA